MMRGSPSPFVLVGLALVLVMAGSALAQNGMSDQTLRGNGFDDRMLDALRQSRYHEPPVQSGSSAHIPPPVLPAATATDRDIPEAIPGPTRLLQQDGRGTAAPYEGPTRVYQGGEAREIEGTFSEVENFFFRPGRHYDRFLSMNDSNVTGLIQMFTGEVERKSTTYARFGFGHVQFKRAFGNALLSTQTIEQIMFPMAVMMVPAKDLELSLTMTLFDEKARNFPLIRDYSLTGVSSVVTTAKYRFVDNPEDRLSLAFLFQLIVAVENTVTRIGSNGVDFLMGLAMTKRLHNFGLHVDGGWIFANGEDRTNNRVPDVGFAGVGVDFQTGERLDWIVELNYVDFQNVGNRLDITPGLKWKISDKWRYNLGFPIALHDTMAQGFTYRLTTSLQFRF
ncbi:MAG: hypothetical protein HY815_24000 [Candidatus Riflebacteria bacterium]|nr:hypothetical protein [Candidatus Riflebacteria bacterium]